MNKSSLLPLLAGASVLACGSVSARADESPASWWEGFAGVGYRSAPSLKLSLKPRTRAGAGYQADAASAALAGAAGATDENVARDYDDGSVGQGDGGLGLTSDWSYAEAGQVRASSQAWGGPGGGDQSLYLSRTGPLAVDAASFKDDMDAEASPLLELRRMWARGEADIGLALSWSKLSADTSFDRELSTSRTRLVDEFFLYGIVAPAAPYDGPPTPPGPLLDNAPHQRTVSRFTEGTSASLRAEGEVDVHTFSLGAVWRSGKREDRDAGKMHANLQAGLSANFVELDYRQRVTIVDGASVSVLSDSYKRDTVRLGYYASGDLCMPVSETVDLVFRGRYDLLPEMQLGDRYTSALVDVSGWSLWFGCSKSW